MVKKVDLVKYNPSKSTAIVRIDGYGTIELPVSWQGGILQGDQQHSELYDQILVGDSIESAIVCLNQKKSVSLYNGQFGGVGKNIIVQNIVNEIEQSQPNKAITTDSITIVQPSAGKGIFPAISGGTRVEPNVYKNKNKGDVNYGTTADNMKIETKQQLIMDHVAWLQLIKINELNIGTSSVFHKHFYIDTLFEQPESVLKQRFQYVQQVRAVTKYIEKNPTSLPANMFKLDKSNLDVFIKFFATILYNEGASSSDPIQAQNSSISLLESKQGTAVYGVVQSLHIKETIQVNNWNMFIDKYVTDATIDLSTVSQKLIDQVIQNAGISADLVNQIKSRKMNNTQFKQQFKFTQAIDTNGVYKNAYKQQVVFTLYPEILFEFYYTNFQKQYDYILEYTYENFGLLFGGLYLKLVDRQIQQGPTAGQYDFQLQLVTYLYSIGLPLDAIADKKVVYKTKTKEYSFTIQSNILQTVKLTALRIFQLAVQQQLPDNQSRYKEMGLILNNIYKTNMAIEKLTGYVSSETLVAFNKQQFMYYQSNAFSKLKNNQMYEEQMRFQLYLAIIQTITTMQYCMYSNKWVYIDGANGMQNRTSKLYRPILTTGK